MLFPKPYADFVQRIRVPTGILLATAFAVYSSPTAVTWVSGLPLCCLGLGLRAWAAGHLRKNEKLTASGPYGWLRNPLYLGTLLTAAGFFVQAREHWLTIAGLLYFWLVYQPVMEQEEAHLASLFDDFEEYRQRTPMLLPRKPRIPSEFRFDFQVYLRNKEFKALWGFFAVEALLVLKLVM